MSYMGYDFQKLHDNIAEQQDQALDQAYEEFE